MNQYFNYIPSGLFTLYTQYHSYIMGTIAGLALEGFVSNNTNSPNAHLLTDWSQPTNISDYLQSIQGTVQERRRQVQADLNTSSYPRLLRIIEDLKSRPWFFAGLTSADGCFTMSFGPDRGKIKATYEFALALDEGDIAILDTLQELLGVGNVSVRVLRVGNNTGIYKVSSRKELLEVVIPFFDQYPPSGFKFLQYRIWRYLILIHSTYKTKISGNPVLALENRKKMVAETIVSAFAVLGEDNRKTSIEGIQSMHLDNRPVQELEYKFWGEYFYALTHMFLQPFMVPHPDWVAGAFNGDGGSSVTLDISTGYGFGQAQLNYNCQDKGTADLVKNGMLGLGTVRTIPLSTGTTMYRWTLTGTDDIATVFSRFFIYYPVYEMKLINLLGVMTFIDFVGYGFEKFSVEWDHLNCILYSINRDGKRRRGPRPPKTDYRELLNVTNIGWPLLAVVKTPSTANDLMLPIEDRLEVVPNVDYIDGWLAVMEDLES